MGRRARDYGGALLLVALAPPAHAAEPKRAETAPPPAFSWAGFHLGATLGAGFPLHAGQRLQAGSGFTSAAYDLYPQSLDRAGVSFGANAGYDWQSGPWVYGLETELNFLDNRHGPNGAFLAPPSYWPAGATGYTLTPQPGGTYFASLRGRLGYALGDELFYAFAGVASGGWLGGSTLAFLGPGAGGPFFAPMSQSSRMKYLIGAGVAHALDAHWSARLEYMFLNQALQNQVYDNGLGYQFAAHQRNETHLVRLGLDYRLPQPEADRARLDEKTSEIYSVHAQFTDVVQGYPRFPAAYSGPNSYRPQGQARDGSTSNLFLGMRLWDNASVFINPEIDQGYGLSNSTGSAAYVNGAVAKVGAAAPYWRMQRYFLRQIIGLGGGEGLSPDEGSRSEVLESAQNQLAGKVDKNRLVLTIGKFSVGDVFDDNVYAHDPLTGFLNFAFNTMGAFDYAADAWGYTHGAALEWQQNWWTLRGGLFQLSTIPNGPQIEPALGRQFMGVIEAEGRYELFGQPGAIKFLAYGDNGYFSKLDEVTALAYATGNLPPTVDALRRRRVKMGGGINIKQQLMPNLGFFLRASMLDGRYETVDYTDVDKQLAFGLVASGPLWGRAKDEIGAALAFSGLSGAQIRYFSAGGISVYIGDGALTYGGEKATELYYKYTVNDWLDFTLDHQLIVNPGHNSARAPANVFGVRMHAAF